MGRRQGQRVSLRSLQPYAVAGEVGPERVAALNEAGRAGIDYDRLADAMAGHLSITVNGHATADIVRVIQAARWARHTTHTGS